MDKFDKCHSGGLAYEMYKSLEYKFTEEFNSLTFNLLVELYIRDQLGLKNMFDRDYVNLVNTWTSVAKELGVLRKYPYPMNIFPPVHPMSKDAVKQARCLLGMSK